jgi:hypothetical protein
MSQLTSNTQAFVHSQQYGMVKKPGVKVTNPFKQFQLKRKKK